MSVNAPVADAAPDASAVADVTEAAQRPSIFALLGWLAFSGMLVYIVFIGGGYAGILSGSLRVLSLILVGAGLTIWALLAWRRPEWRPRTAIWPVVAVPFLALFLTSLTSANPRLGLEYVAWAVVLVTLYLLLVRVLAMPMARARIGGVAAMLGFVTGIAYLYVAVTAWLEWWDLLGRLTAPMLRPAYAGLPFGGPTVVTSVVILLTAVAFGGLGFSSTARRVTLAALSLLTIGVVVLTGSRASWLGLAVALGLVGLGLLIAYRDRLGPFVRDRRVRIGAVALVIAAIPVALVFAPALLNRLATSGDGGRSMYFATATRMFESSPIVGVGPGNWTAQRIAFMQPGEPDVYVAHSHNIYLQTLAEMGLVGAIAGLVALAAIGWLILGALRGADGERRRWAIAGIFILLYAAVFSLVDSYVNLPLAFLLAGIPIALLDATSPRSLGFFSLSSSSVTARRTQAVMTAGVFVVAFGSLFVLSRVESIASVNEDAVVAISDGDWAAAETASVEAVKSDPGMTPYQVTRGIAAAGVGDWETAEVAFRTAALTDDLPQTWMNVALAGMESGASDAEILDAVDRARRIGDQHSFVTLASGYVYDRLGMTTEADGAFSSLIAAIPSLAADTTWADSVLTSDRFDALIEAAIAEAADPWEVALMAGQLDRARELSAAARDPWLAATFVEAWSGDAAAVAELVEQALARPDERSLVSYAARATAATGDAPTTERLRRIAIFGSEAIGAPGFGGPAQCARSSPRRWCTGHTCPRSRMPAPSIGSRSTSTGSSTGPTSSSS